MKNSEKIAQIIEKLSAKGLKTEASGNLFGFTYGKHVWHWFELKSDGFIYFNHSYSQNTGSTTKGLKKGFALEFKLEEMIGSELYEAKTTDFAEEQAAFEARCAESQKLIDSLADDFPFAVRYGKNKNQIAKVASLKAASEKVRKHIEDNDLGSSQWCDQETGKVFNSNGDQVARISYNGRIWDLNEVEIVEAPVADQPAVSVSSVTVQTIAGKDYKSVSIKTGGGKAFRFDLHESGCIYIYFFGSRPSEAYGGFLSAKREAHRKGEAELISLIELAEAALVGTVEPLALDDPEAIREGMIAGRKVIEAAEEPVAHGYVNPDPDQPAAVDIQQAWRDWCGMNPDQWQLKYPDGDYWHYAYQQNPEVDGIWIDEANSLKPAEKDPEAMFRDAIGLNQAAWYAKYPAGDWNEDFHVWRNMAIQRGYGLQTNSFPVLRATHPNRIIKAVVDFTYPKAAGFDRSEWMKSKAVQLDSPTAFLNFIDVLHQIDVDFIMIEVEDANKNVDITARAIRKLIGQDLPGGDDQPDPDGGLGPDKDPPLSDDEQVAKYGPESEKLHDSFMLDTDEYVAKHYPDQPTGGLINVDIDVLEQHPPCANVAEAGLSVDDFPALAAKYQGGRILQIAIDKEAGQTITSRAHLFGLLFHFRAFYPDKTECKLKIRLADGGSHFCRVPLEVFNPGQPDPNSGIEVTDQGSRRPEVPGEPRRIFSISLLPDYDGELNRAIIRQHFEDAYDEAKRLADDVESFYQERGPIVLQMLQIKEVIGDHVDFLSLTYFKRVYLGENPKS